MDTKPSKSLLSLIFILILLTNLFFVVAPESVHALQDGDYIYEINGDPLAATITEYVGAGGEITIPSTLGGYPTVSIGSQAFMSCDTLTIVTIPDSVLTIDYAAFSSCTALTSITIGHNVTTIGNGAFDSCVSLTSVTIPNNVITIGNFSFISCSSLATITIGDRVTTIGNYAFESCSALTSVIIPDNVTTIGRYAFYNCTNLTSISIGNSLSTIGNYAFSYCTILPSIMIPSSVTSIGAYVFQYCTSLTAITVDDTNTHYSSINGVLYNKDITTLIQCPAGKTDPISIPNTVDTIGKAAFFSCVSLTDIIIPSHVDTIGDYAFSYCPLTTVTIPNSVITIGVSAFAYTPITSVTIGSSINAISNYAFTSCASLNSITFYGLVAPPYVGINWILNTPTSLRGHAYVSSNFPAPGGIWNGLTMGTYISENNGNNGGPSPGENQKPVANTSTGEPYQGYANREILFNGSKSCDPDGYITSWDWNFGDGTTGSGKVIKHIYTTAGTYEVILTVTDNNETTDTATTTCIISQNNSQPNRPPTKPILSGIINGSINSQYTYTVESSDPDNDTIQYLFNWGDNTTHLSEFVPAGTSHTAHHSWANPGQYTITVTVTDNHTELSSSMIINIYSAEEEKPSTPGFELVSVISAIMVSLLLWKKKRI